ncbi:MAG: dihydrolipoamide acetyltransferase family protein [Acidimicrobiia bacterium]
MVLEFRLPDIGEGLTEAEIVEWLVNVGDRVEANQPVVEVETAKTTVEIPSPQTGVIRRIEGAPGDTVAVGDVLFVVADTADAGPASPAASAPASTPDPEPGANAAPQTTAGLDPEQRPTQRTPRAMPIVRQLAKEQGIDLSQVVGTGPGGAVTRADLDGFEAGDERDDALTPLSAIRRTIAVHMTQSWTTIPHVTVQAEVRSEALMSDRSLGEDAKLPIEALVATAVLPLLNEFPDFNASYREGAVEYKEHVNLGFAVDTEDGLMVVVVKDAADMDMFEIATEFERLSAAAIAGTATPVELTGQTFTISNIGALGGGHGTPLIPVGTSSIVSIGRATEQPVVEDGELAVGWVAPLDLSYDHRLIDGGLGQRFLGSLVAVLETPVAQR